MARNPFDQFSKQFFEEFLTPLGQVRINYEIPGEAKFVDIWFIPSPSKTTVPEDLGLLSRIAQTPCLLEPYRKQPTNREIRSCLYKLYHLEAETQREAKREEEKISDQQLPQLWIITTSCSERLLEDLNVTQDETWGEGIYFLGKILLTRIIVIDRLNRTPDTLWLRILGKGLTQKQAVEEVIALPAQDSKRNQILRLLYSWKISIEVGTQIDLEDTEVIMNLSQAYLEWEEQTQLRGIEQGIEQGIERGIEQGIERGIERGIEQGIEQERRQLLENLLTARFGEVDSQLAAMIPAIISLNNQEYAALLLQLPSLSREDLLARFNQ
ncbi:MAG: hypothetical protein KME54_17395 [Tolypothrix brevis GSE-NOS-MK-07-07A]|jgi:hypothetical protein|nr:hypothetical protein [Tolypothrix brevis GSE-NOS-MK-07-07A]